MNIPNLHYSNLEDLLEKIQKEPEVLAEYMIAVNTPRFQLREVGISSKLMGDWEKLGLLVTKFESRKWRGFSLIEAFWVKFIVELRNYGVPINRILEIKEDLFISSSQIFKKQMEVSSETGGPSVRKAVAELNKKIEELGGVDRLFNELPDGFNLSNFSSFMMGVLVFKINIGFLIDEEGWSFIRLDKVDSFIQAQQEDLFIRMTSLSHVIINLRRIVQSFFQNEKLFATDDLFMGIMNKGEKALIDKIRIGNYVQVVIKIENGSILQFRVTKKDDKQLLEKLQRLMKQGDYKEIELITRDGKIVKLMETDIIKM